MRLTGLSQLIKLTRPVVHTWIAIFLFTGALVSALFDSSNCANCQQIARANCQQIASKLPVNCLQIARSNCANCQPNASQMPTNCQQIARSNCANCQQIASKLPSQTVQIASQLPAKF